MTWLITDRNGELHEVLEDERILVLCGNQREAHDWLREVGIPPYGRHLTLVSQYNDLVVRGGRWDVYVFLPGYSGANAHSQEHVAQVLLANEKKQQVPPRKIHAA